ncbi:hypothetical protein OBBRIDRAFT_486132 [Obba rivulosa]|uniref:Alpha/beta hydrolase fold-3 domain-containing protein n=1 Tax=Obba rivulosa TaxID=1052685 RepID=A0A8E2B140_9APHY|nr:hypothetical protein OBBRIDRAFT_486132 [Obba rivulosa]
MTCSDDPSLLDPEYAALLDSLPPPEPPLEDLSLARRQFNDALLAAVRNINEPFLPPESEYRVQDHSVLVDGGSITVRCLTPTPSGAQDKEFPLLYWTHGGGWVFGSIENDDLFLRTICFELQIVVININYRLSPENPFPVPLNDAYAGLKWAAENASLLYASLKKGFILSGTSAGANLAAVLAHRARDDPFFEDKRITGQLLQIPPVVHPDAYPEQYKDHLRSYYTVGDSRVLDGNEMDDCYEKYGARPFDPECSPLLYTSHKGLAPAFIQVCSADPLRDEAILYERILREAGIKTMLEVYPGVGHGFHIDLPESKLGLKFVRDFKRGLKWLLGAVSDSAI